MSKVVHLSDDAHNLAKDYCTKLGVKMSDWVAELIVRSITGTTPTARPAQAAPTPKPAHHPAAPPEAPPPQTNRAAPATKPAEHTAAASTGPKKKPIVRLDVRPQTDESGVPAYAAPPFWARAQKQ